MRIFSPELNLITESPFGSVMNTRNWSASSYRFGFQRQEKENNISGNDGDYLVYKYRIHDARLGRFLSVDPLIKDYPWNSPYAFSENRVTNSIELEGLEAHDLGGGQTIYGPYKDGKAARSAALSGKAGVDLNEMTVVASKTPPSTGGSSPGPSSPSTAIGAVATITGAADQSFDLINKAYDHNNYVTTTGKTKPIYTAKGTVRSAQAQSALNKSGAMNLKGLGLNVLSTTMGALQLYDQLRTEGELNPVDATAVGLGTVGTVANAMSYFGYGGATVSGISSATGVGGMVITTGQLWYQVYKPMFEMKKFNSGPIINDANEALSNQQLESMGIFNESQLFIND